MTTKPEHIDQEKYLDLGINEGTTLGMQMEVDIEGKRRNNLAALEKESAIETATNHPVAEVGGIATREATGRRKTLASAVVLAARLP